MTGGGQEFVRVYAEDVYGVPTEQVVGSSILTKYEIQDGKPVLMREPKPFFVDDGDGNRLSHRAERPLDPATYPAAGATNYYPVAWSFT